MFPGSLQNLLTATIPPRGIVTGDGEKVFPPRYVETPHPTEPRLPNVKADGARIAPKVPDFFNPRTPDGRINIGLRFGVYFGGWAGGIAGVILVIRLVDQVVNPDVDLRQVEPPATVTRARDGV